jgi:hypothetical protein
MCSSNNRHLTEEDIEFIQENVGREWGRLVARAGR